VLAHSADQRSAAHQVTHSQNMLAIKEDAFHTSIEQGGKWKNT
jgi:hypothetical protein